MQTKKNKFSFGLPQLIYLVLLLGFITAVAQPFHHNLPVATSGDEKLIADNLTPNPFETTGNTETKKEKESKEAFLKAYTVFMHPRCMNCHPAGDVPLQGDDSHLHLQGVKRGPDGKGLYAMKCKNCHQDANLKGPNLPPGSPEWKLPPASKKMVFEGCTPRQLALHFKDNNFTGFKTLNDMIHHVEKEPLVINSFIPLEGLSKIPMSHEEFVGYVKEWIAKGVAVPDK